MKTTIKLSPTKSLTIEPAGHHCNGGIIATIQFSMFGVTSKEQMTMTADQCGALIFGIEQALPVAEQRHAARAAFEQSAG